MTEFKLGLTLLAIGAVFGYAGASSLASMFICFGVVIFFGPFFTH